MKPVSVFSLWVVYTYSKFDDVVAEIKYQYIEMQCQEEYDNDSMAIKSMQWLGNIEG